MCPTFAHIRRKLRLRPFPIDPPFRESYLSHSPSRTCGNFDFTTFDAYIGLVDNETSHESSAALYI